MTGKEIMHAKRDGCVRRVTEESEQSKGSLQLSKELIKGRDFISNIQKDLGSKQEDTKYKNLSR
jgi:hypothetical protein